MSYKQNYTIQVEQVIEEQRNCESHCNELTFVNRGAVTAYVEKYPLGTGEFLRIGGNIGEKCTKVFNLECPAGSEVYVFRKFYI